MCCENVVPWWQMRESKHIFRSKNALDIAGVASVATFQPTFFEASEI